MRAFPLLLVLACLTALPAVAQESSSMPVTSALSITDMPVPPATDAGSASALSRPVLATARAKAKSKAQKSAKKTASSAKSLQDKAVKTVQATAKTKGKTVVVTKVTTRKKAE